MAQQRRPAIKVRQWLDEWDQVKFDAAQHQRKPDPYFYMVSMRASDLRRLAGVHRRDVSKPRAGDTNVQRRHDAERSTEIARFVKDGYPLSTMSSGRRLAAKDASLRKPGWLPSSLIVNIMVPGDVRTDRTLAAPDAVTVDGADGETPSIVYPASWDEEEWRPEGAHPIEVIDGQHRLWAFDEDSEMDFELPVVAFFNLDISWQAYLFWSVNIKPKRINASLAFDLYPLLREQSWLTAGEGAAVYRDTRAQELTEALWATPESPWFRRINMLGDTGVRAQQPVTQAAFVRSLTSTFVRPWSTARTTVGGLFGGLETTGEDGAGLAWTRAQQAGLLVFLWHTLERAVAQSDAEWAEDLRDTAEELSLEAEVDAAFASPFSLLASDQGVRPVLSLFNDLFYVRQRELGLRDHNDDEVEENLNVEAVSVWVERWSESSVAPFASAVCESLAAYDWRNSKAPSLDADERRQKLIFRGSGGYKELRSQLIEHLTYSTNEYVEDAAETVRHRT